MRFRCQQAQALQRLATPYVAPFQIDHLTLSLTHSLFHDVFSLSLWWACSGQVQGSSSSRKKGFPTFVLLLFDVDLFSNQKCCFNAACLSAFASMIENA